MNDLETLQKNIGDKEWRMSHLYKIVDKNAKRITFKHNRSQADFEARRTNKNIILKSRRLGFTTYEAVDSLDDTLFTSNFTALFTAHNKDDAKIIFNKKVSFAWKNIDEELRSLWKVDSDTASNFEFDFGDDTSSSITVSNSGRGGTNNRVHVSEFAKICKKYPQKASEIVTGTFPSVPPKGRTDIESTAEGMSGDYYEMFIEAWYRKRPARDQEFTAYFYNWTWDDEELAGIKEIISVEEMEESKRFREYQELHNLSDREITYYYSKWCVVKKDWDMLHQEYPTTPEEAFIASGSCFFNQNRIQELLIKSPEPLDVEKDQIPKELLQYYLDKELTIYALPEAYGSYVSGGDVAEGKGGDSSVLETINNKTAQTAISFKSNRIRPDDFAKVCNSIGRWYNNSYLGIESNSGQWLLTELLERLEYPNLYFRRAIDDITHKTSAKVGFHTGGTNRKPMLDHLLVQVNLIEFINKDFLHEALTFVRDEQGRPEAEQGKNDDTVIATGIAHYIRENAPAEQTKPVGEPHSMEDKIKSYLENKYD